MERVDSKIPRHLNTIFQIPPSRNCISHSHMDEKNQLQNSKALKYNCSTPFTQTKSTFHICIWMKLINYKVPSHLDTMIQIPSSRNHICCNPNLRQVWGWDLHSQKWELSLTSELDCRGQNTSPWGVGKALKCRCRKWPCMSHSNICSTSYGRKKGRESNW
jgi:hypothetical protein